MSKIIYKFPKISIMKQIPKTTPSIALQYYE